MGKAKVFGGGGGMFVRNADKAKYRSYSGDVPGNTFVQKTLKGSPTSSGFQSLGSFGAYPSGAKAYPLSGSRAFCLLPYYASGNNSLRAMICKAGADGVVTYGTALSLSSVAYSGGNCCATVLKDGRVLVCHYDSGVTSRMRWRLCEVSNMTISVVASGQVPLIVAAETSRNSVTMFNLSDGRVVLTAGQGTSGMYAFMVTIAGKTVTFSSGTKIVSASYQITGSVGAARLTDDKFMVVYFDAADSEANSETRVALINISANGEFSTATPKVAASHYTPYAYLYCHMISLSETLAVIAFCQHTSYSTAEQRRFAIQAIRVTGDSFSIGGAVDVASGVYSSATSMADYDDTHYPIVAVDGSTFLAYGCTASLSNNNILYARPIICTGGTNLSLGGIVKYDSSISPSNVPALGLCKLDDGRFLAFRQSWQAAVLAEVYTAVQKTESAVHGVTVTKCAADKAGTVLEANYS